jgi:very-short-patch-repair endonuclease
MAAFFLSSVLTNGPAQSRGSTATERPHAAEHIEGLSADLRRGIASRERACGNTAAAGHYFSVSIEAGGQRFVSLHFEDFVCTNRAAICNVDGCLHEIYLESRGRHRLVFSVRARDVKMTDGGGAGLEVNYGTSNKFFRWNGARFVPAGSLAR